jgi:hypothetical protein
MNTPMARAAAGCTLMLASLTAAESKYAGSRVCEKCHPAQSHTQSMTGHAHALSPARDHALSASFTPSSMQRRPPYEYRFTRDFHVRVFDTKDVMDIPLEWAFGAGEQAVTFVSRIDRDWYLEHFLTFYRSTATMAATPGQNPAAPKTLPEAAGLVYKAIDPEEGIVRCFQCHSTGPVDTSGDAIRPSENGVRCEACHGPGADHARNGRAPMTNPRKMTAAALNEFCGKCHRPPAARDTRIDWDFAWSVRHQPVYLSQSACFQKSAGTLSCLSCHAPHEPLRRDDAAYNRVCGSCHAGAHPGNCVDCHMPRVSPAPPLRFTNHWIGVYRGGARLRPVSVKKGE